MDGLQAIAQLAQVLRLFAGCDGDQGAFLDEKWFDQVMFLCLGGRAVECCMSADLQGSGSL